MVVTNGTNLKPPDNSGRGAVVVLVGAGVTVVHIIALQSPREPLEVKPVIDAAPDIDRDWVIDETVRIDVADASHGVDEGTPFSIIKGNARTAEEDILRNWSRATPIVTAAIEHDPKARKTGERQVDRKS